jgi:DNA gyrase/topoisomerase IV subunit A
MLQPAPTPTLSYKTSKLQKFTPFVEAKNYDITVEDNHEFYASGINVKNCMGKYHPHGDSSIYSTYVTLVNSILPLIDGKGNWGSLFDPMPAAMRYTNLRMSKYTEKVFFDPFYTPAIVQVENYDRSQKEPLVLPALLPNLLLNGNFGIGVGVKSEIPAYTLPSVVAVLQKVLKEKRLVEPKDCLNLEYTTLYKAKPVINKEEQKQFYKTGKGKVTYKSTYSLEKALIRVTTFPSFNIESAIAKCQAYIDVAKVNNESEDEKTPVLAIYTKKSIKEEELKILADTLMEKVFTANDNYIVNVVDRIVNLYNEGAGKLKASTVPGILNDWITFRIQLEKDACAYWVDKVQKEIDYRLLLIKAVDQLEIIIKALRQKFTKDQLRDYIAKHMKLSHDQAEVIISLRVYQLRRLSKDELLQEIQDRKKEIAGYQRRIKDPNSWIADQIAQFSKELFTNKTGKAI